MQSLLLQELNIRIITEPTMRKDLEICAAIKQAGQTNFTYKRLKNVRDAYVKKLKAHGLNLWT